MKRWKHQCQRLCFLLIRWLLKPKNKKYKFGLMDLDMMVFGNVKKDAIELVTPFGATFHNFAGGFNHR